MRERFFPDRLQYLKDTFMTGTRTLLTSRACFACLWLALVQPASAASLDEFFQEFTGQWVRSDPDLATTTRFFSGEEQQLLERQLTPQTRAWQLQRIALARDGLKRLRSFDVKQMDETRRLSAELMRWQLEALVRGEQFLDYFFPLEQFGGANVQLVDNFIVRHPLATEQDALNFIARLGQIGSRMDEAVAEARRLASQDRIPPNFIVAATIRQMQSFIGTAPDKNPLVTSFVQRLSSVAAVTPERREQLAAQVADLVEKQVYPAWSSGLALLETLRSRSNDDAGLWRYKGGDAVYAYALQRSTTTNLTAAQIHEIGLAQVARLEGEIDRLFKQLGRNEGSVRERVRKLKEDLAYPNAGSEDSRALVMSDVNEMIKNALRTSGALFDGNPRTPVIAQPFPRFREANAAANYNRAPMDGSRPAIFQIPLRPERITSFGLRTLVYHETVPGHHFQIASEQENPALPRFRQARVLGGIAALSEGWALYAERLAVESGWYEGDPQGLIGALDAELFRARRLVVDTGLHAMRWTRQQAIDYGVEASEVERYVVNPGQACSYMIGQLQILELRDRARQALGEKFSPKQFHRVVLGAGTVPLDLLEREVDRYIAGARL
jgi:uncharacterized protein (DUF885 family)